MSVYFHKIVFFYCKYILLFVIFITSSDCCLNMIAAMFSKDIALEMGWWCKRIVDKKISAKHQTHTKIDPFFFTIFFIYYFICKVDFLQITVNIISMVIPLRR